MPFEIVRGDITKMNTDAIVNAANSSLLGGGGVDGAIHSAAGPRLLEECRTLGGCETGHAKITRGYNLPAKYVIHTVGPVWYGGSRGEAEKLASCYRESLRLADEHGCESVAFPLISAGAYGYPKEEAREIAAEAIRSFLQDHEMNVFLVIRNREDFAFNRECHRLLMAYLEEGFTEEEADWKMNLDRRRRAWRPPMTGAVPRPEAAPKPLEADDAFEIMEETACLADESELPPGLREFLARGDEGFRDMLLRKIDEQGMKDADCYKAANVDRKLFNKIKNNPDYHPGKPIVLAFAVALRLPLRETEEMLTKAGYAFSPVDCFDKIVKFFIRGGNYDIYRINDALFYYDQKLLGSLN